MQSIDAIKVESDECGFELHLTTDEGDEFRFNMQAVAWDFYEQMCATVGPWVAEGRAAKREFDTGIADDPTQQALLDRIRGAKEGA